MGTGAQQAAPAAAPGCALGTGFLLCGGRGEGGGPASEAGAIFEEARALGATGLLLCEAGLPAEVLHPLVKQLPHLGDLPVLGVDGLLGAAFCGQPGLARAQLAALDRDESRAAATRLTEALRLAEACGAPYVFTGLGPIAALGSRWEPLRGRFLRGELLDERGDSPAAARLAAERMGQSIPHLWACLRALDGVLSQADQRGVTVLVRNPRRGLELPNATELRVLLAELQGAPLRPLLDLPAAHLASAMRLLPLRETVDAFSPGPLCLLGDACGALAGLVPGQGEIDVAAVARALPAGALRGYLPWAGLRRDEVAAGCAAIRALPCAAPAAPG